MRHGTRPTEPERPGLFEVSRHLVLLVAALALALRGAGVGAQATVTHPYLGVTYTDRIETTPRAIHMHVVQIDLDAPGIRFKVSPPGGRLEVVRQSTLEYLKAEHAQVAVNAHFFLPWPSTTPEADVIGIGASDGRVFSGFETPEQSYALVADAPGVNIDAGNRASLIHRNRAEPDGLHTSEGVALWNAVAGSAQIVSDGVPQTPRYRDARHPDALLTPGGPNQYSNAKSWYEAVTARTAIGLSRDGRTLTLFTVDARGGSVGMTPREVAETLVRDFGAWNALNLDGGGSTSMAMEDPVTRVPALVNVSSDNPAGRVVASSLAVFANVRRPAANIGGTVTRRIIGSTREAPRH